MKFVQQAAVRTSAAVMVRGGSKPGVRQQRRQRRGRQSIRLLADQKKGTVTPRRVEVFILAM